jgi:hypothetical protein
MNRLLPRSGELLIQRLAVAMAIGVLSVSSFTSNLQATDGTEFTGTVLLVDPSAGKLALKKEGTGTRFTFVANDTTRFEGGLKGLADIKKGDSVTVQYQVSGSQYIVLKITPKR